jgi:Flp pilus assembly protein TadD
VPALLTTANLAMSRGQLPAAVTAFRAAMDKEPSTGTAIMLAHAHIASQQTDKALQVLDTWSRKSPDDRIALRALAEVQMQAGKNDDARKSYQRALAQDPDEASTLSSYASLLHRLGDPAAAATAEKAVKLAPGNPEFADVLGWILVQQGNVEAGLRHLREARLRDPNNGGVRYHLAYALAKAGRKAEARDELGAMLANASRAPLPPEVTRLKNELGL